MTEGWLDQVIGGDGCEAEIERSFLDSQLPPWREALMAGLVTFSPDAIEPCLEAFAEVECGDLDLQPAACDALFTGEQAPGASCVHDIECAGGTFCDTLDTCPGRCAAPHGEGERCEATSNCVRGLICGPDELCQTIGRLGEPCEQARDCSDGLHCQGAHSETEGECVPFATRFALGLDEPCSLQGTLCVAPLSCVLLGVDGGQERYGCVEPVEADASCLLGEPDPCPDDRYCSAAISAASVEGVCVPRPGTGGACTAHFPAVPCAEGLSCLRGLCLEKRALGELCQFDGECYSFRCVEARCVEPGSCRP